MATRLATKALAHRLTWTVVALLSAVPTAIATNPPPPPAPGDGENYIFQVQGSKDGEVTWLNDSEMTICGDPQDEISPHEP